jgi:hypothetical protein
LLLLNKYLKTSIQLVVCLFLFKKGLSQNLIQNGSFENYTNPIDCGGGFDNASVFPITHVVDNWYTFSSPDYFNPICNNNYADVPVNLFGYSQAKHGNSYAGIGFYQKGNEMKEYIYQQLSTTLDADKVYCINFFVSRTERSTYATKNIEVYFSASSPTMPNGYYIVATPQVIKQNSFITDTSQWTQIQGCFTANGTEQYITIGNFNSNANTDTLFIGTNNPIPFYGDFSYYYIDDITLIDQTTVGINELNNGNNFEIYPNPNNGIFTIDSKDVIQKIEVTNIAGQTLFSETTSEKTHQLHLNHFSQGIYFIKVSYQDGLTITKKVIVNP